MPRRTRRLGRPSAMHGVLSGECACLDESVANNPIRLAICDGLFGREFALWVRFNEMGYAQITA